MISHSMGGLVVLYFMKWVESPKLGHQAGWCDKHIHAFVSIASPYLGVPKTLPSIISGEMRDTAQLGYIMTSLLERFFTKAERAAIFRSWQGVHSMLPKGGNSIWGNSTHSVEDTDAMRAANRTHGNLLAFADQDGREELQQAFTRLGFGEVRNFTLEDGLAMMKKLTGPSFRKRLTADYSQGLSTSLQDMLGAEYDD